MSDFSEKEMEQREQIARGKRIKRIREEQLNLNKSQLSKLIGVKGQFLKRVEDGRGNLMYGSLRKLCLLSDRSADYILFGLDDSKIDETREMLDQFSHLEILHGMQAIEGIVEMIKNK